MEEHKNTKTFYQDNHKAIKTLVVSLCFLGAFAWANLDLTIFNAGEVISSAQVNSNFQKLKDAFSSDLVLRNTSSYTITDPSGCKSARDYINVSASGVNAANYDSATGGFSFPEEGLYEVIYSLKCSGCSKRQVYLCSNADVSTTNCLTESKLDASNSIYIADINSTTYTGDKYVKLTANKVYRLLVPYLCGDMNFPNANDIEIYFRKVR